MNLTFELGQSMHTNKNPYAEIAIKEGHLAINKADNPGNLTVVDVTTIARVLNLKIHSTGYSSWELFTRRSTVDNNPLVKIDQDLGDEKLANKLATHNPPAQSPTFNVGDLVMVKIAISKLHPRDT